MRTPDGGHRFLGCDCDAVEAWLLESSDAEAAFEELRSECVWFVNEKEEYAESLEDEDDGGDDE
jgi:hypothetical protein